MKKLLIICLCFQNLLVVPLLASDLKRSDILREIPQLIDLTIATEKNWDKNLVLDKTSIKLEEMGAATKFFNDMFSADLGFIQLNLIAEFKDSEYNLAYELSCPILIYMNTKAKGSYEISFMGKSLFMNTESCFLKVKDNEDEKIPIFNSIANPVLKIQAWVKI